MTKETETYLGDGLYASFDGWQIRLRAPRDSGDHEVFLDADMLISLTAMALELGLISPRNIKEPT